LGLELAGDLISEAIDAGARSSDTDLVINDEIFRDVDLQLGPLLYRHIYRSTADDHHITVNLPGFVRI
jgi:hypothetical protein